MEPDTSSPPTPPDPTVNPSGSPSLGPTSQPPPPTTSPTPPTPAAPIDEAPTTPPVAETWVDPALVTQGQSEPQVVPEQRPQAFISPVGGISTSSQRLDGGEPATQEQIDTANSDKAKQDAIANSLMPRYYEGQRVTFVSGPEQGRMGYVSQVVFKDEIQQMVAAAGIPGSRFAEVSNYIIRTRDGRSDIIVATPDQVTALDDIEGWGRGQI